MRYAVVFERSPRNYAAYVPDLPGCIATGRTRKEVELRLKEAINMHVEELRKDKLPVPRPVAWADVVDIPA